MKKFIKKAHYVMSGEDGASNLELVVWFSVVLIISVALFAFKDQVVGFLTGTTKEVGNIQTKTGFN